MTADPSARRPLHITAESHPRLHAVCGIILHDMGCGGRDLPPTPTRTVTLPISAVDAALADGVLARLTAEERDTFAIGEASEADAIAERYGLDRLHAALNDWVDGGLQ